MDLRDYTGHFYFYIEDMDIYRKNEIWRYA